MLRLLAHELKRMQTGIRLPRRGALLCLGLGLVLPSCRNDAPPRVEVCIGDGFGGADCVETNATQLYRSPSMLKNYWMTGQPDEANFAAWCYGATPAQVTPVMTEIESQARH